MADVFPDGVNRYGSNCLITSELLNVFWCSGKWPSFPVTAEGRISKLLGLDVASPKTSNWLPETVSANNYGAKIIHPDQWYDVVIPAMIGQSMKTIWEGKSETISSLSALKVQNKTWIKKMWATSRYLRDMLSNYSCLCRMLPAT
jgi:hypothetical protein